MAENGYAPAPPQDLEAEQSVLGAMLMSKDAIAEVVEVLRGADFYRPNHEIIFDAIVALFTRGEPADTITVAAELTRMGELQKVGGPVYLHDLHASVPIAANAAYHASIVRDKAILRRLVNASIRIAQIGYQGQGEVDKLVDEAQQTLYEVTDRRSSEDYKALGELLEATYDEVETIQNSGDGLAGVPTGFTELDRLTNGLHPGQMIIVAARPAVGKSTFALDICRAAAIQNNLTTAFFSLEMSRTEIVMKVLSAEASVLLHRLRGAGRMEERDWQRLTDRVVTLESKPFFIDDSPNLTMMEIRAKARRLKQRNNLQLLVIDYLQLMSSGKRVESRQLEVSEFSRQIKLLAKELEIPVVALSQLSRNAEQRKEGVPQLSDLRESGSIEQDADIVIMLHRPELYTQDPSDEERGQAFFHVLKHRNGETRRIEALFQGHYSRFTNPPIG
ncbi:replicative DNA helicase [Tessaracoccus sp. OH4464_COT-324]|uniref:replicative DNA helicase n=1 Tax=Tessaracoccus sp. OH4464_COT-324 TaxID=2491059 RepID=UPI001F300AD0|nr:replicative DNA helicase [Tessaracoccus sp. OH4464_COT-324]